MTQNGVNINITAQELKSTAHNEHEEKDVSLTAGISNAYVNTALAVKAVVDATEELHKAEQKYQEIKKLFDEGRASQQALDDAKENMTMASVNLAIQTTAATMAAIGAAGSASNSMGTGMQGDAGLTASINKSEFDSTQITNQGSLLLSGGNINTIVRGANVQGADVAFDVGGDLLVESLQDEHHSSNSSKSSSAYQKPPTHIIVFPIVF